MEYESLDRGFHPNRGGAEFTVDEATVAIRNHQKPEASRIGDNDGESCLIPPGCSHVRLTDRISAARALRGSRHAVPEIQDRARRLTPIARPRQLQMLVRWPAFGSDDAAGGRSGIETGLPVAYQCGTADPNAWDSAS